MRPTGWLLPVAQAPRLKLRFVTVVAKLFGTLPGGAGPERPATLGAKLFPTAVGTIGGNKEDTFHKGFLPWWRFGCPLRSAFWPSQERDETPAGGVSSNRDSKSAHRQCLEDVQVGVGRGADKAALFPNPGNPFKFLGSSRHIPMGCAPGTRRKFLF